ncbi:hypothetical protein HHK36_009684 [Tetracentron sinense]|uniref:Uncharacterized protein n=1 Tax=Tetracentron sinense TaxID=13715 RepID=A0A834ZD65_TETSI|nr:hypothetical protein HHK36_009684 [Tetracentron sinense]
MASLQFVKSGLSPFLGVRSVLGRKSSRFCSDSGFTASHKRIFKLQKRWSSKVLNGRGFRVCCRLQEGENESNGYLEPEILEFLGMGLERIEQTRFRYSFEDVLRLLESSSKMTMVKKKFKFSDTKPNGLRVTASSILPTTQQECRNYLGVWNPWIFVFISCNRLRQWLDSTKLPVQNTWSSSSSSPVSVSVSVTTLLTIRVNSSLFIKKAGGEEPPESLFMKELKRRGMTPTSLLEDRNRSMYGLDEEIKLKEDEIGSSKRNLFSTDLDKRLSNQRERSMALNSEGLEGLIPRAKLLLTIGGSFFIGFWPLILITVAFFFALDFYFGSSFVHDASKTPIAQPPYIDPYALLEDEKISQLVPHVN